MLELSQRHCDNQLKSRDMTIKLLEHNNKLLRIKLQAAEKEIDKLRLNLI